MTLLELSEPLFQYICRLTRSARKGGNYEPQSQVQIRDQGLSRRGPRQGPGGQPRRVVGEDRTSPHVLLRFYGLRNPPFPGPANGRNSPLNATKWPATKSFFDLLEETLKDKSPSANERLAVFYTCMGVGFTGWYTAQPEYLRRKMKEIAARLQAAGQFTETQRICPDAYEKVDTRDLIEPPGTKLIGIGIALVGLLIVLFFTYGFLYRDSSTKLVSALHTIEKKSNIAVVDTGSKESDK